MTRTIVLSQESNLLIKTPSKQDKVKLTIDGQTILELKENSKIAIKIDSKKCHLFFLMNLIIMQS